MKKDNDTASDAGLARRMIADFLGGAGMILIAVGLLIPIFNITSTELLPMCKWIYTAGALMFTGSKCIKVLPADASFRLRRLKRLEFWAGICFLIGVFFWFYNQDKFGISDSAGPLAIIHDTILFSLSGAVVMLVAVWLVYFRTKKEMRQSSGKPEK